jgi:hypothetical protein
MHANQSIKNHSKKAFSQHYLTRRNQVNKTNALSHAHSVVNPSHLVNSQTIKTNVSAIN